jgi:hypothetical protein
MDQLNRTRLRLLHFLEQLAAGLDGGEPRAEQEARIILARVVSRGSADILAQVFRGIIREWDSEQADWDAIRA